MNARHFGDYLQSLGYGIELYNCDSLIEVNGFCSLSRQKANSITWVKNFDSSCSLLKDTMFPLLVVSAQKPAYTPSNNLNFIIGESPKALFFEILKKFFYKASIPGIGRTSTVLTKNIGVNVSIGEHCYICEEADIGDNVIIRNNVSIECPARIGNNCVIESGCVIGSYGYGYFHNVQDELVKVPDFGGVVIGDNVEIGANTCIDRGTLDDTIIGDGVKIDNLCHIAHNVQIEKDCMVIALSLLAGSVHLGERAYIAPGAMVINQAKIGRDALVGMGAVVTKDVADNMVVAGVPAKVLRENK